ncbi:GIY-YIG nuclease family protein [Desulfosporosinus youngiae]|uniref:Group I intron endonuclease n=1 Tax=Desulfosporosinus youngiae DSM 17734 TaxID=768710 RepID=H5Y583_9FIRM|nr:GIY-YIG nuclease family protein [Desulfosporosinus youngiae]EHQ90187.1 group I intron endonuclease [Desulfosporosinus youngiae DSM 17734]
MIGVYQITNNINNKVYIGRSNDIERRWKDHIRQLNKGTHNNQGLQNDWNKYGEGNFAFEIIKLCDEKELKYEELDQIFTAWHELYNVPSIKDNIVYLVSNYLKSLNADFEIDHKSSDCANKQPLNFNVFALSNEEELYLSLRNKDFIKSEEDEDKYKKSSDIKQDYVLSKDGDLIEVEYGHSEDGRICYDIN